MLPHKFLCDSIANLHHERVIQRFMVIASRPSEHEQGEADHGRNNPQEVNLKNDQGDARCRG